jgi:peptide-methionine (S)-S-oxide reductase
LPALPVAAKNTDMSDNNNTLGSSAPAPAHETALFAAGCFWHVELAFRRLPGVVQTTVGYSGGHLADPSYEDVCSHTTGHAETVRVQYDPAVLSYGQLLEAFWNLHDPTQRNRQGPDVGDQYRSAIFYLTTGQRQQAEASKAELEKSGRYQKPIATLIEPAREFWPAEEYHQRYLEKHGRAACHTGL